MARRLNRRLRLAAVVTAVCGVLLLAGRTFGWESPGEENSCVSCHGDASKMTSLGFRMLAVTQAEAEAQTKMPATCPDCHLGDGRSPTKEGAHKGLLRPLIIQPEKFEAATRDRLKPFLPESLTPGGGSPLTALFNNLLYHDKDPQTLSINYPALEKTCGKCHREEIARFRQTAMGSNAKQSLYRTWTDPRRGPHNCGVWFADGYKEIAANSAVPFARETAQVNQKACNVCHVGCLDCHYAPSPKDPNDPSRGTHSFTKAVSAETCYGGGRGAICHAGPEERRRGGGYIGGEASFPRGALPDVHYAAGLRCTECHATRARDKSLFHGQVKRQVTCLPCHESVTASVGASVHRKVSCEACHIRDVGGYAATFWGPGEVGGERTPYAKYNKYYGVMKEPILVRDQRGRWIPVKPYAMGVLNQKGSGALRTGFTWRYPKDLRDLDRTDDAYAFVGLFPGVPGNDNLLAWIQMDKVSHKYGKARECDSCHTERGEQRAEVTWEYSDQGAAPFKGRHKVTANKEGLVISGMLAMTEIRVEEGSRREEFAPWLYVKDVWQVDGDFSVPPVGDPSAFEAERTKADERARSRKPYHDE